MKGHRRLGDGARHLLWVVATMLACVSCGGGQLLSADPAPGGDTRTAQAATGELRSAAAAVNTSLSTSTSSLARTAARVPRDSPWGVASSASLSYRPEAWLPAMSEAGVVAVRGFDAGAPDERFDVLARAGVSVTGVLFWSSGPGTTLPVNDLEGWRRYVTAQVTRYKGRVRYWEVWNEPPNFTDDRSPVSYGKVVAAAYDAAKAVDPNVQIGLAAKSNHVNFLAQSIDAGAADKFDFITLHPYENVDLIAQGWEGQFMGIVPAVRKMLADRDPLRRAVPVWFTEVGAQAAAGGETSPQTQSDALVKIYTMGIAQGIARVHWFDPQDSEGASFGLTAADGTRRPAWYALRTLVSQLGAHPAFTGWTQPDATSYGFVFAGTQGTAVVAWARRDHPVLLDLPAEVTVFDPRTGASQTTRTPTLTDAPSVMVAAPASPTAVLWSTAAASNAGKAFPWSTDHSAAASVSLTAGVEPDGVRMIDAPPATWVDGVPEFRFVGRYGPRFTVDPAFLSYDSRPIRITVVVRDNGTGYGGFNLKYESDTPLAQADGNGLTAASEGWHTVSGSSFYEKSWTLPNPRFVGFYGYNFILDTDGTVFGHFSIQKVTVTRL